MKRRAFLKTSTMAAAGTLMLPALTMGEKKKYGIGLQLYTLRDVVLTDPKGVLKKVAEAGYQTIEAYSYKDGAIFGLPYKEFSDYVNSLGMKITSGHYSLAMAGSDSWEKAVEDAKAIGQEFMVVPYIDEKDRSTLDLYKNCCDILNKAGELCNKFGVRFGYHNHDFEFKKIDGVIPYDLMLKELEPSKVGIELDLYWVIRAGHDPLAYFKQFPGRFEQWHVKDMDKADPTKNEIVGAGQIDFKPLFKKAKLAGLKRFYVEQETYKSASIDCIKPSANYLRSIL